MPFKIISGGQKGADRAGLDAASNMSIKTGGWAPQNYMTEDGPDASLAGLGLVEAKEEGFTPSKEKVDYAEQYRNRTLLNVEEADVTILFGRASPGYNLTKACCKKAEKPILMISYPAKAPNPNRAADRIVQFIQEKGARTVNVAGNREKKNQGIYDYVFQTMLQVCQRLKEIEGRP